jgi:hypothetical protein
VALIQTDGTTARTIESAVVWRQGVVSTGTAYVDLQYSDARTAGYSFFKLVLSGVRCPSKNFALWGLRSAGTPETAGYYGGVFNHGESAGSLAQDTGSGYPLSSAMNNNGYFSITAGRDGAEGNVYLGHYTIYITDPVASAITGINGAYPNVWWHGTHRTAHTLAANISGGGVNNRFNSHYGVRFGAHDGSTAMDRCTYVLTAYKGGGGY